MIRSLALALTRPALALSLSLSVLGASTLGCGSGDAKKSASSSSAKAKSSGASATSTPGTGAPASTGAPAGTGAAKPGDALATLNVPIFWQGAKYTLGAMSFVKGEGLKIEVEIEDLLKQNITPSPTVMLELDGAVAARGALRDFTEIVGKSKIKNQLQFNLEALDVAKTILVFGEGDRAQVRVPLSALGPNVTNEPAKQAFTGDVVIGPATFSVSSVEVRWDTVPHDGEDVKKDKATLVLVGKMKAPSDKEIYITADKFSITQPDGSKVTGDHIGPDSHVLQTKTLEDFYITFTIDAKDRKFAGDYTLEVTQPWGADGGDVSAAPTKLTLK